MCNDDVHYLESESAGFSMEGGREGAREGVREGGREGSEKKTAHGNKRHSQVAGRDTTD